MNLPVAISTLALVVSSSSFYLSYLGYRSGFLPAEISTRLNTFAVSDDPLSISANFDFSVSNHSSRSIFIVNCEVAIDGLPTGGGGYGERFAPCNIDQISSNGGLELASGQTEFFTVEHLQSLDDHSPVMALDLMGIDLAAIRPKLAVGNCVANLSTRRNGGGMNQNCQLMQSSIDSFPHRTPTQKVFDLVLQTGTGDLIRGSVYLSLHQPWPWGM